MSPCLSGSSHHVATVQRHCRLLVFHRCPEGSLIFCMQIRRGITRDNYSITAQAEETQEER